MIAYPVRHKETADHKHMVLRPDGWPILLVYDDDDVAKVVAAINAHAPLTEALRKCRDQLVSMGQNLGEYTQPSDVDAMNAANTTLAAHGKEPLNALSDL
jgi:hypothetical protein